jgi:hypothetical protein
LPVALSAQQPTAWQVSTQPILQIGEADGDSAYMFFRARNATRLADGRILVLNAGSQQFRIYDTRGKLVLSKGRRGRGPGEFSSPARMTRPAPDTIAIFDNGRQKLYTFTIAGTYIGERMLSERDAYDGWYYKRSWIEKCTRELACVRPRRNSAVRPMQWRAESQDRMLPTLRSFIRYRKTSRNA